MLIRELFTLFAFLATLTQATDKYKKPLTIQEYTTAYRKTFPFMARIEKYGIHQCDGTILGKNFVLTVAHCLVGGNVFESDPFIAIQVVVPDENEDLISYSVRNIYIHYNYAERRLGNTGDIALVRTNKKIKTPFSLQPLFIIDRELEDDEAALVTGYGIERSSKKALNFTPYTKRQPEYHRWAQVSVVTLPTCEEKLKINVRDDKICAGEPMGSKDPCVGTGGGPLIVDGKVAGIANWNIGCGKKGKPGVYTSTYYYRDWIYKTIRENS